MDTKTYALVETYSRAFVDLSKQKATLDQDACDIIEILNVFRATDLRAFLSQVNVDAAAKAQLVRLFQASGSERLNNFLEVISQNERQYLLYDILEDCLAKIAETTNTYDVTVITANSLNDEQRKRMSQLIEKKFDLNIRQFIEVKDTSIIGGFIIKVNNKIIDASLKTQLQMLKRKINK